VIAGDAFRCIRLGEADAMCKAAVVNLAMHVLVASCAW
jgi:hypothetical protein